MSERWQVDFAHSQADREAGKVEIGAYPSLLDFGRRRVALVDRKEDAERIVADHQASTEVERLRAALDNYVCGSCNNRVGYTPDDGVWSPYRTPCSHGIGCAPLRAALTSTSGAPSRPGRTVGGTSYSACCHCDGTGRERNGDTCTNCNGTCCSYHYKAVDPSCGSCRIA